MGEVPLERQPEGEGKSPPAALSCMSRHPAKRSAREGRQDDAQAGRRKKARATWPLRFFTNHETRITKHGFFGAWSTEALQSCFFRPGMLGNSSRRRRGTVPCGSRIRASQAFTDRKPLILRSLRNTNHETRVTAVMFFTNHEARNTNHGCCVFHETRDTKHGLFGTCWY